MAKIAKKNVLWNKSQVVTTFALNCPAMDSKAIVTLTERITKTD